MDTHEWLISRIPIKCLLYKNEQRAVGKTLDKNIWAHKAQNTTSAFAGLSQGSHPGDKFI